MSLESELAVLAQQYREQMLRDVSSEVQRQARAIGYGLSSADLTFVAKDAIDDAFEDEYPTAEQIRQAFARFLVGKKARDALQALKQIKKAPDLAAARKAALVRKRQGLLRIVTNQVGPAMTQAGVPAKFHPDTADIADDNAGYDFSLILKYMPNEIKQAIDNAKQDYYAVNPKAADPNSAVVRDAVRRSR